MIGLCAAVATLIFGAWLCVLSVAWAHDEYDWIRRGGYRDPVTKDWCCGKSDCVVIPARDVMPMQPGWLVRPSGEVVPYRETLPSEDGRFWRCHRPDGTRRCFFAPPRIT